MPRPEDKEGVLQVRDAPGDGLSTLLALEEGQCSRSSENQRAGLWADSPGVRGLRRLQDRTLGGWGPYLYSKVIPLHQREQVGSSRVRPVRR